MRYFETQFLEEVDAFISRLDVKTIRKILYNIDLAEQTTDPKLLKKLQGDIWEFRTKFAGLQIRLLAFWDKSDNKKTLIIATHGFIKKVDKVPSNEIDRAVRLKNNYYSNKRKT
ncbi:type II toxin-antitoxin system RelE/ParE family toxin [uncultured Cytophaga sp.]|uniref:type II toxin-antitoxin system RelE/ParE family toxin n=1 Tax=uncultured Cytophaga sp. TaxID=160238 RepID=UPI00261B2C4B|nr:type II toxin-antitoxin system RelE/ParE family toxin [uncultured Cytophaga sp.]